MQVFILSILLFMIIVLTIIMISALTVSKRKPEKNIEPVASLPTELSAGDNHWIRLMLERNRYRCTEHSDKSFFHFSTNLLANDCLLHLSIYENIEQNHVGIHSVLPGLVHPNDYPLLKKLMDDFNDKNEGLTLKLDEDLRILTLTMSMDGEYIRTSTAQEREALFHLFVRNANFLFLESMRIKHSFSLLSLYRLQELGLGKALN